MNRTLNKRIWLAGASMLAIVLGSGDANAVVFQLPGSFDYMVPSTGWYDFRVAGAQGGSDGSPNGGGVGALVGGKLFLAAGNALDIVVGGEKGGQTFGGNGSGGGGGGGSFVWYDDLLFAAGGGGGAGFNGPPGGPGIGTGAQPGGGSGYGHNGAGGSGVPTNYPFAGSDSVPFPAENGSFPSGGQGAGLCLAAGVCGTVAPMGGYGGGGGGAPGGAAGQGGYSYVIETALDSFGITEGNSGGSGYASIEFFAAPETSTWAMMLAGFSALGGMLLRRGWKAITPI